ncbi:hypothetical protein ACTHQ4_02365 [Alkalicoccobacillus gibsonii]
MMFPPNGKGWTLSEIDQMDVLFFEEIMTESDDESGQPEKEEYLGDIW